MELKVSLPSFKLTAALKSFTQSLFFCSLEAAQNKKKKKKSALFNHAGKIEVSGFDSFSSRQTLQVREQVEEVEHEMCCYANNTYLSPRMKWEASRGISRIHMKACTESL